MHKADIFALLSRIGGLSLLASDAQFSQYITALAGPFGPKIVAIIGLLGIIAADVSRILSVPTQSSGGSK